MQKYLYVNTKLGTLNDRRFSNGNVLPVTAVPHGMASFTIQNDKSAGRWFYSPLSKSFEGIRLTHQPSPWLGDYGNLVLTGQHGKLIFEEDYRWSSFDNRNCIIQPAYMKGYVYRDRYLFELAPTVSGAVLRFTFEDDGVNRINIIGENRTEFVFDEENGVVFGYTTACSHKVAFGELKEYFVVKPDAPFTVERGNNAISMLVQSRTVVCRIATSFLSREQALLNFRRETEEVALEDARAAAEREWESYLSRIEVEDDDEEKKAIFYTCMYRAFLWPRKFYETDEQGKPRHLNMQTGEAVDGYMYTDNGFWDTYRTLYPYLSLIDTKLYAEMAESYYNYYKDSGWLPKWLCPDNFNCMPGMLVEATMADAVVKEIVPKALSEKIFRALLHDGENASFEAGVGRTAAKEYREHGYIPYTSAHESVNETLDCCYGDYCIAQAANKLGYTEIAARYYVYAKNYRNVFDENTGFMRGKDVNGKFRDESFDCFAWGRDYTEGSAWQSSFAVYHDIEGLNKLYKGKLADKIDELVAAPKRYSIGSYGGEIHEMSEMADADYGQCAVSNQPSFHIPYIYSELGDVKKTADLVEKLLGAFRNAEDGFPGDEDNGSMCSWYILSCLGFYQMAPSRPDFTMSLPQFKKITVRLSNGNKLLIERDKMNADNLKNRVSYAELMKGGELALIAAKKTDGK